MTEHRPSRSRGASAARRTQAVYPAGGGLSLSAGEVKSHQTRLTIGACILLFLIVAWAFLPSLRNGFVDYDDSLFVTENAQVQAGVTWHNVIWAFGNPVAANWHPLTTLSHMLDCEVYGLKP